MRLLFSGVPAFGHLLPLVPLVRAAQAVGHDVAVLTSAGMSGALADALPGVRLLSAGPMADDVRAEAARRLGSDPARDSQPGAVAEMFAGVRIDLGADEALEAARAWRPDALICEAVDFVGPLVAAVLGVPWHLLAFGPAVPSEFSGLMMSTAAARYADRGVVPRAPSSYIDPCPPSMQLPGWTSPVRRLPLRAEAHSRPRFSWAPPFFPPSDYRVRVLVTFGTVFDDALLLASILAAIDPRAYYVTVTGRTHAHADSEHVRFVPFVPLSALLDHADVVVSAGGAGTVLGALARGLPMVLLPQGADQPLNAARAAATGAAEVIWSVDDLPAALVQVVRERTFSASATQVAAEIAQMGSPSEVITAITDADALAGFAL